MCRKLKHSKTVAEGVSLKLNKIVVHSLHQVTHVVLWFFLSIFLSQGATRVKAMLWLQRITDSEMRHLWNGGCAYLFDS